MRFIAVLLCGAGVFTGESIWPMMDIRQRSAWPGYRSHAIVDLLPNEITKTREKRDERVCDTGNILLLELLRVICSAIGQ